MTRPLIILSLLLVANFATPKEALSQAPDMRGYQEAMRNMQKNNAKGKKGTEAKTRAADTRDEQRDREEAAPMGKSAQTNPAPAKATSFEPFKTKPLNLMAVLDSDGDGMLSGSEIDFATDQLLRLDANDNGQIDADELPGSKPPMAAKFDPDYSGPGEQIYRTLSNFDKNADGMLTRSEIKADYRGVFRSIDTDGDKGISPNELLEYVKNQ